MLRLTCTEGTAAVTAARGAQSSTPKLAGSSEEKGLCPRPFLTHPICPPISKRAYCLSITWEKSLALGGVFHSLLPWCGVPEGPLPAVSMEAASCPFFFAVTYLPLAAFRVMRLSHHSMSK